MSSRGNCTEKSSWENLSLKYKVDILLGKCFDSTICCLETEKNSISEKLAYQRINHLPITRQLKTIYQHSTLKRPQSKPLHIPHQRGGLDLETSVPFQEISQPSGIGRRQIFLWSSNILPATMCLVCSFLPIKNLLQCVWYLCILYLSILFFILLIDLVTSTLVLY